MHLDLKDKGSSFKDAIWTENTDGVKEASKRSSVSTLNNQLWTEGAGYDASCLSPTMQF